MSTSSTACSDSVCSICLDTCSVASYADGCLHKFCGRCIFEWAQRSQLCPICRTFFANIITNVTSDTDYEVIPLEDSRLPVSNLIRNPWWINNNGYPSNRNIFAVRQFNHRSHQPHQHQQPQPQQLPSSSIEPSRLIQHQETNNGYQQITRGSNEPDFGNLQIDNPRPRRVVWSSNRYSHNRQFNNRQQSQQQSQPQQQSQQQPQPTPSHHENVVAFSRQIISPAFRTDYHNRGQNQPLTSPHRHSSNPRPFRPLVGIRQDNHFHHNQHQNQNQQHLSSQSNPLNVNYQQPHHHHHQHHHYAHSNSHSHSYPHPHHFHFNYNSSHSHNSHQPQLQPHHSQHDHPHSGPHHHQQTACKRLSRPNERQWRR